MKARSRALLALLSIVLACCAVSGCLDFTPITLAPGEGGTADGSTGDSGIGNVDAAACEACVEGAQCSAQYQTCTATPKCDVMFQCGASRGCYEHGANLVACLTICGQQAGLASSTDPAITPFLELYNCATVSCASACGGS